jgi:hypothetical protein
MSMKEQRQLFEREFGEGWNKVVVPTEPGEAWHITGRRPLEPNRAFMDDATVTPSLDAGASGHWHGFITNGEIR